METHATPKANGYRGKGWGEGGGERRQAPPHIGAPKLRIIGERDSGNGDTRHPYMGPKAKDYHWKRGVNESTRHPYSGPKATPIGAEGLGALERGQHGWNLDCRRFRARSP